MTMPTMPKMSRSRKAKPSHPCACGCGRLTKGTWFPGDDGRATGWARRIAAGKMVLADVPENERAGAQIMLDRNHGMKVERPLTSAERKAARKAERLAAKAASKPVETVEPVVGDVQLETVAA